MRTISVEERRRRLGKRHHLARSAGGVEIIAADLVGLHSSDPVTVYLSAWARRDGLTVDDVDAALYRDRSLVRMLGMRRTLFVVPLDIAAAMNSGCTSVYAPGQRRRVLGLIEDQLVDGDGKAWLNDVLDKTNAALHARGEATAKELVEDVPELARQFTYGRGTFGLSTRVLFLLATSGTIIRARPLGTFKSSQYRWTPLENWLPGGLPEIDPPEARQILAERWLRSFGPGTLRDLKWWTGWTVRDTKAALESIGAVEVAMDDGVGYVLADDLEAEAEVGEWVAFLPSLDPTTMGWKERDWYLNGHARELFDTNGNAGPTVWRDGRVVGGWGQRTDGRVVFELLEEVPARVVRKISAESERLTDWFDGVVVRPRFPTPMGKRLRG